MLPTDPSMQAQLDQLMAMVTLIGGKRLHLDTSQARSAGLTGTGVIAIQGLIGCKVDITTLPTQLGDLRLARRTFRPRVSDVRHARRLPNVDPN